MKFLILLIALAWHATSPAQQLSELAKINTIVELCYVAEYGTPDKKLAAVAEISRRGEDCKNHTAAVYQFFQDYTGFNEKAAKNRAYYEEQEKQQARLQAEQHAQQQARRSQMLSYFSQCQASAIGVTWLSGVEIVTACMNAATTGIQPNWGASRPRSPIHCNTQHSRYQSNTTCY